MAKLTNFSAVVYGDLKPYNDVLSLARCRIFYKGANRNGTFITDEFADQLLSTIAYTPVKGIYDSIEDDYTDHGTKRYQGRIYGIVPKDYNFSWEQHEDVDGFVRTYACVDVFLFTGIYPEAKEIPGKSQSMELFASSIEGTYQFINGNRYFVYTKGHFLGLQVLGEEVEPCFEGASFFNLHKNDLSKLLEQLETYNLESQKNTSGGTKMPKINFKLSDNQKFEMLWSLLNPNFNEEGEYTIDYMICDVYDKYAVARNLENGNFERVYYDKNDESDSLEITGQEVCFIVDVNEQEKTALDALNKLNGNTFEKIDEEVTHLKEENSEYESKIKEHETTIATLNQENEKITNEKTEVETNYQSALENVNALTAERDSLAEYKANIEKNEKINVINQYTEKLDEATIEKFTESVDEFAKEDLEKELAFALVNSNPSLFNNQDGFIPKDEPLGGIEEILSKYENK